jgi:type IV secretory pathway TrbL component
LIVGFILTLKGQAFSSILCKIVTTVTFWLVTLVGSVLVGFAAYRGLAIVLGP